MIYSFPANVITSNLSIFNILHIKSFLELLSKAKTINIPIILVANKLITSKILNTTTLSLTFFSGDFFLLTSSSFATSDVIEVFSFSRICFCTLLPELFVFDSILASVSFSSDVKPAFSESSLDINFSFS